MRPCGCWNGYDLLVSLSPPLPVSLPQLIFPLFGHLANLLPPDFPICPAGVSSDSAGYQISPAMPMEGLMQRLLPLLVLVAMVGGGWFVMGPNGPGGLKLGSVPQLIQGNN